MTDAERVSEEAGESNQADETPRGISRRGMLALFGAAGAAAGLAVGVPTGLSFGTGRRDAASDPGLEYPFFGPHQGGIVTPAQDQMFFAAFDIAKDMSRGDLIELLQDWTYAASRMTMGLDVSASGAFGGDPVLPPDDTGEASGLGPHGLTITFGFGRSLFQDSSGKDRFGLKAQMPKQLRDLPPMVNDFINPDASGGDIAVQACANDPQIAVHAIRNLTRMAFGRAAIRWSQLGFGRSSSTSTSQKTPRNLFGQKDGTANIKAEDREDLDQHVWINGSDQPKWARGGTYMVARRIMMTLEIWDGVRLEEQERVTGRDKREGAPLSGGSEFTKPDFSKTDSSGRALVDDRSHVFRTHPTNNDGIKMLRRGYNFVDGNDELGRLNAGLFFIAFVNDPARFAKVHKNMARDDMFVEYLKTSASSVFIIPPGIADGGYVGQGLFTS